MLLGERVIGELRVEVLPLMYGRARLCIGRADDRTGYDREY